METNSKRIIYQRMTKQISAMKERAVFTSFHSISPIDKDWHAIHIHNCI